MPGDIWWADLITARRALGAPTPDQWAAIARTLGYAVTAQPASTSPPAPAAAPPASPAVPQTSGPPAATGWQGTVIDSTGGEQAQLPVLEPVAEETVPAPAPLTSEILASSVAGERGAPRRRSLLAPRSTNAILQALLSRTTPDGPPDIEAAIQVMSTGNPVTVVPRASIPTLRFGTQILVDLGDGMRPFRRDQADVVDTVRRVAGAASTSVVYFADVPTWGAGPGPRWTWRRYQPPAPGTRVLLLTDFGIGGKPFGARRGSRSEWIALLDVLGRQECRPVALVPYPAPRWPTYARSRCALLTWDRHTTVVHASAASR